MGNAYEGLILECLSRIKALEEKVEVLENQLDLETKGPAVNNSDKNVKITRSTARQYVIDKLNEENKNLIAVKGNQSEGSGIVIKSNDDATKKLIAKFYYSKSHLDHISSWHTVGADDINNDNIDLHIFAVSYNEKYFTFFFTKDELRKYVSDKRSDNSNLYHFYFQKINGKYVEIRDEEKEVSKFLERWTLVSNII
ncbi:hypothetical protein [Priestia megaterium]|uniref:hypothetical protein n=1 Tax=Priestia megaterium TaxID=1404 RepID=UPI002E1CDDD3|nr:hypothetical protein [Priestia megaterium]